MLRMFLFWSTAAGSILLFVIPDLPLEELPESASTALVDRLRHGEESAFREVFVTYFRVLCEIAYLYVKSSDLAQELVQDVFCRLWEQRSTLAMRGNLRAYLYVAVRHRALDLLRHQRVAKRVEAMSFDEEHPGMGMPVEATDQAVIEKEQRRLVRRAIEALPERQRMVFQLRWEHHLSYAEIAEVMGVSIKGVEAARKRALESLQKSLRGVFPG